MLGFTVALIILALIIQQFTLRNGFKGVAYSVRAGSCIVEPDEPFEVVTVIDNTSRRFIPFVRMYESLPSSAAVVTAGIETRPVPYEKEQLMLSSIYLMPRQRLERRVAITMENRGCYFFNGATMEISDFLGLAETVKRYKQASEVVVVPPRYENHRIISALGGFLGNVSVRRFIMEDPVLTIGFREYTMHEPLKMISWTQTARRGEIMVKSYDYTVDPTVTVLLNIQSDMPLGRLVPLIEVCYSLARTVCEHLEDMRVNYGFLTNAGADGAFSKCEASGEGHGKWRYMSILEELGRASYIAAESYGDLVERAADSARQGGAFIIITPHAGDRNGLDRLSVYSGGQICVISAEEAMSVQ